MKASEFVKEYGWDEAKHFLKMNKHKERFSIHKPNRGFSYDFIIVSDLKRLVESWELVEDYKNRESGKWFFIADYCKKNNLNPFDSDVYEVVSNKYDEAIKIIVDVEANE